jgi:hypothetical protein
MFQTKVVGKIRTHMLGSITFPRKLCRLRDNVEKLGRAGRGTDDNIIRRMRCACWVTKATNIHSECVILTAISLQKWFRESTLLLLLHAHCLSC